MFENIIGNEAIKKNLEEGIKNNKILHSYLFLGISGIGKKMIATEFAYEILGSKTSPDFLVISPDGNSIKIEQIRELQKKIQEKPIVSNKKIYIIDNADSMTREAQNCLLKTLEEPPEYAIIILIGTNENDFLVTIKSRCMILKFKKIEDSEIKKYIENNYNINVSSNMLEMFQGSIGKAIELKEEQNQYSQLEEIVFNLTTNNLIQTIKKAEILYNSKEEIFEMLEYLNVILLKMAKTNNKYVKCIKIVEDTKKRLEQNANYDMTIDNMVFNLWEEVN